MGQYYKKFVSRIAEDFRQKELLPVKVLFFVHMSTILVLYPYLTIHMRELGINVEETAIMSAVTPVIGILMPPLAGLLADKIGNFKVMLALFSVFSGLSALLLLIVPIGRITVTYPTTVTLEMSCSANNPLILSLYDQYPCEKYSNSTPEADITVQSCGFICQAFVNETDTDAILRSKDYNIKMHNIPDNRSTSLRYTVRPEDYYVPKSLDTLTNHAALKLSEKYSTTIRKMSENSFYFPSQSLYNFSCNKGPTKNSQEPIRPEMNEKYSCLFANKNQLRQPVLKDLRVGFQVISTTDEDRSEKKQRLNITYIKDTINREATCTHGYGPYKDYISVSLDLMMENETVAYKNLDLGSCAARCIASSPRLNFCSNPKTTIDLDIQLTFWSYLVVRVFIGIIGGTAYTMFEGAVIAILREYKADYGLQRMYASFGGMISSPLSGLLIDYASEGKSYTDFRPIFFLYAGLKVTSAVLMLFINLEFKRPAQSVVADVISVMNIELISLFVAAFLLGSAWGYIESFLFWLLQDLGGTKSLMGLTVTVGGILGIPLLALSGPLIKKIGHANIIFIGFLAYAVRLLGYSLIYNPWLSLIFEAMECLTHSLCFTAAVTYAARLSSITTDTTIQGILGGLFYGVGKSFGSLVGGYLIKYFGMRGTFQIFAAATGLTAFIYLAFYHIYMKKRTKLREAMEKAISDADKKEKLEKQIASETNAGYQETEFGITRDADKKASA